MGMSTHVVGFRPPDEKWEKMKAVWDASVEADVSIPREVKDFFEGEDPDPKGVAIRIPVEEWQGDMQEGVQVWLDELPPDIKVIRFYNSW